MPQGIVPLPAAQQVGIDEATALANCHVRLFSNNLTPGPTTDVGDLVESTFHGYVAQLVVAPDPPVIDPVNNGWSIFLPSHTFVFTAGAPTETAYGAYVTDAGGNLRAVGRFTTPIVMDAVGKAIPLQVAMNYANNSMTAWFNVG
jgi:hypothetical protein